VGDDDALGLRCADWIKALDGNMLAPIALIKPGQSAWSDSTKPRS